MTDYYDLREMQVRMTSYIISTFNTFLRDVKGIDPEGGCFFRDTKNMGLFLAILCIKLDVEPDSIYDSMNLMISKIDGNAEVKEDVEKEVNHYLCFDSFYSVFKEYAVWLSNKKN